MTGVYWGPENHFLKKELDKFLEARDWKGYHNPKNVAMSVGIEAAELMELFQWNNPSIEEVKNNEELMTKVKDELADVLIYAISLARALDIDLFDCIKMKMDRNKKRFPPKTKR